MENLAKTPVEIVQELIAIHTTRKEAVDKLTTQTSGEELTAKLSASAQQSDQFIAELMDELSNYGDSVQAGVDRQNEYQVRWKETLSNIDGMNTEEYGQAFEKLEDSLRQFYAGIKEPGVELPASLQEIVTGQAEALGK